MLCCAVLNIFLLSLKYFRRLLSPGVSEFIVHIRLKWDEGS